MRSPDSVKCFIARRTADIAVQPHVERMARRLPAEPTESPEALAAQLVTDGRGPACQECYGDAHDTPERRGHLRGQRDFKKTSRRLRPAGPPAQSASETLDPSGPPRSAGLRRAVRMAGEVTDRALGIPYVKGAVRLPAILFTVSAVPSGGKPPGTQRGGPAGIAGTDLPYHGGRHGELLRG